MNFSKKDDEQMDSMGINKLEAKLSLVSGRYIFPSQFISFDIAVTDIILCATATVSFMV